MSVTVYPKVVYIRRKQGYDYGGDVNHIRLEYKGFYNPHIQQQKYNNYFQPQQQQEPLALFVSKPNEQIKPFFDNVIVPQNQKPFEWESFKLQNNGEQIKQDFEAVLQKPPQYPPVHDFYPGLRQPQDLYVGFDNNAIQQPAEAAKQNFNALNLPKLQQPQQLCQQQQHCIPQQQQPAELFGGHFLDPTQGQQQNEDLKTNIVGPSGLNDDQQQGNGDFKQLFQQIPNDLGGQQGFVRPNEQNIIKFSNEDAVEPQEFGKVQFGKGADFNGQFGFGVGGLRDNMKKRRPKRVRPVREPQYTYIIRARRHRD